MPSRPPLRHGSDATCDHCGAASARADGEHLRCVCGSLLARLVTGAVELKCRRCKRTVLVPLHAEEGSPLR